MSDILKKQKTGEDSESVTATGCQPFDGTHKAASTGENENSGASLDSSAQEDAEKREETLRETDVGITEYISSHAGFNGVLKQRFSDFLVNEVGLDNQVVELTDTSAPQCDAENQDPQKTEELSKKLTPEQHEALDSLASSGDHKANVTIQVGEDKAERGLVHEAIRQFFPALESKTDTDKDSGSKLIKVTLTDRKKCQDKRVWQKKWPADRGDYCHFVLYKENKDTMEAVNLLAKLSRLRTGSFMYAGTKDKRAKTSQIIAVHRVTATKLHGLNKVLKRLAVGNFKYCNHPLKLGDHLGNKFCIVLRNATGSESQVEAALSSLRDQGFINYYGMQRFGTTCVPTNHIGRAILKSDWQEAIDLILKPRGGDFPQLSAARRIWQESRDVEAALKALGSHHCIEQRLLQGLAKCAENDLVTALANIPRNTRHMYLHAYQSYVWNKVVSERIRKFGLQPVVGDLVIVPNENATAEEGTRPSQPAPTLLTEETVSQHKITQVVLPLPGHTVKLPSHPELQQCYTDLLAQDGLTMADFEHRVRDYSMSGDYRHIVVQPQDLHWQTIPYDDPTDPLTLSDFEKLRGHTLPPPPTEGKFTALKLEFRLPPSTYATMAIREVLKQDTSAAHQATLNVT